jgi:uncharacterized damage-inducible protein DinB
MNVADALLWNAQEVRRRSLIVWRGIPAEFAHWKPDADAMTCIEMVRHVLEGEFLYMAMLKAGRGIAEDTTPFSGRSFTSIEDEIHFAQPFRMSFVKFLESFGPAELETVRVDRSDKGYIRSAGDFIMRMAYHEAVHTGQLLVYLRTMGVSRPNVWD